MLALLAASSVLPLAAGGFTVATITGLLGSLGGNVLANWLVQWAEKNTHRVIWNDPASEPAVLGEMAADLEQRMAHDQALADSVAALLECTAAIPAALDALATQVDAQTDLLLDLHDRLKAQESLLQALRADLRRGDLIQGRLHQLVMRTLAEQTEALLAAYRQGTERLSSEVQAVLDEVRTLRDELRQSAAAVQQQPPVAPPPAVKVQTGGINFGNARIGSIGEIVAGDKISGDNVQGDKISNYFFGNGPGADRKTRLVEAAPTMESKWFEPETVLIAGGVFVMGRQPAEDIPEYETPPHSITLPEYLIGKEPISNRQYAEFIRQTGRLVPIEALWDGQSPPRERLDQPITGVSFYDAVIYCEWLSQATGRSYSLPSEAEWEKAAGSVASPGFIWGRVCEWTSTLWGENLRRPDPRFAYPWRADGRDELTAGSHLRRVLRGAIGADEQSECRSTARSGARPNERGSPTNRISFRVTTKNTVSTDE